VKRIWVFFWQLPGSSVNERRQVSQKKWRRQKKSTKRAKSHTLAGLVRVQIISMLIISALHAMYRSIEGAPLTAAYEAVKGDV